MTKGRRLKSQRKQTTITMINVRQGRPGQEVVCWKLMRLKRMWNFRLLLPCSGSQRRSLEETQKKKLSLMMMRQKRWARRTCDNLWRDSWHILGMLTRIRAKIHRCSTIIVAMCTMHLISSAGNWIRNETAKITWCHLVALRYTSLNEFKIFHFIFSWFDFYNLLPNAEEDSHFLKTNTINCANLSFLFLLSIDCLSIMSSFSIRSEQGRRW